MSRGEYAANTTVPVARTRDEIERILTRFGAGSFAYFSSSSGRVAIAFEIHSLRVEMQMQLPRREDFTHSATGKRRTESVIDREWEQECRRYWRTLANGIKAKLALVEDGISTVEREFLADIMTPDGQTVGQKLLPDLRAIASGGQVPQLTPGPRSEARVIEIPERSG